MSPTTEGQRLKEAAAMAKSKPETLAANLLAQAGNPPAESSSLLLSLMIWWARETGREEIADLIVRMEMQDGPRSTARKALGDSDPMALMQDLGPDEAAENLLLQLEETLLN